MSRSTPGFPISHFLIHYPSATTYLIFSFCCRSHLKFSYSQTLRDWNSEKCFPNILLMAWHLFIWCYFTLVCTCIANLSEKAMAPHSNTLAWKIPWMEEPSRLQSMGSLRVRHDWATSLSLFTFMHWRRKWQPTPVFLPGESQGQGSLVGCRLWGHTELDMTEVT